VVRKEWRSLGLATPTEQDRVVKNSPKIQAAAIMTAASDQRVYLPCDASDQSYITLSVFPRIRIATSTVAVNRIFWFRHIVNKQLRGHRQIDYILLSYLW